MCCSVLQCVAVCFSVGHVTHMNKAYQHNSWNVLQCVAVCCSVLQCVAVLGMSHTFIRHTKITFLGSWNVLQCVLQCVAACCGVMQCVAVCCSVLQCVAVRVMSHTWKRHTKNSFLIQNWMHEQLETPGKITFVTLVYWWVMSHTWMRHINHYFCTQCNTLQHTATHCNTFQLPTTVLMGHVTHMNEAYQPFFLCSKVDTRNFLKPRGQHWYVKGSYHTHEWDIPTMFLDSRLHTWTSENPRESHLHRPWYVNELCLRVSAKEPNFLQKSPTKGPCKKAIFFSMTWSHVTCAITCMRNFFFGIYLRRL